MISPILVKRVIQHFHLPLNTSIFIEQLLDLFMLLRKNLSNRVNQLLLNVKFYQMRFGRLLFFDDGYFVFACKVIFKNLLIRSPLHVFFKILNELFFFDIGNNFLCWFILAIFVVHLEALIYKALLSICGKKIEKLPCDCTIKRIRKGHRTLIFYLALMLMALNLLNFP